MNNMNQIQTKSPFLVHENFISPLVCEEIIPCINSSVPDVDEDGKVQSRISETIEYQDDVENVLINSFVNSAIPDIEDHYNVEYRSMLPLQYHWYPQDFPGQTGLTCDNARYYQNKWYRTRDVDFTSILFLNDFNTAPPFDPRYECRGGQIEMVTYNFSFQPQRGTLITFPGCPRFLHRVNEVTVGESHFIKFFCNTQQPYIHDPSLFKGSVSDWFNI